jgi:DNA-binding NarL/FixJ family response regulator
MSRVALLCPDLLLGSNLEGAMRAAGHDITRYDGEDMARAAAASADVLVVDLNAEEFDGAVLVESMRMGRELEGVATLGFYSHVDQETRRHAEDAGFDLVVPRSRIAREAGALVDRVVEGAPR